MDYEINPGTFLFPVGVDQFGVFSYLNSRGWPLLEPGGRPLDDFIMAHDPGLADQLRLNYVEAPYGGCDENGCSVWGTVPAWRSPNFARASNEGANPRIFLTHEEFALLTSIGQQAPPTGYEYGTPLAPFAPIRFPPIVIPEETPVFPEPLPPAPETSPLFPVQTTSTGPGNTAPPASPVAPISAPTTLTPADAPNFGPMPNPGAAVGARLALAALAALLLR